jgi:hypothetical protein
LHAVVKINAQIRRSVQPKGTDDSVDECLRTREAENRRLWELERVNTLEAAVCLFKPICGLCIAPASVDVDETIILIGS